MGGTTITIIKARKNGNRETETETRSIPNGLTVRYQSLEFPIEKPPRTAVDTQQSGASDLNARFACI